jgi:hypothetical protein
MCRAHMLIKCGDTSPRFLLRGKFMTIQIDGYEKFSCTPKGPLKV